MRSALVIISVKIPVLVLIVVLILVIGMFGYIVFGSIQQTKSNEAALAFTKAESIEDYAEVIAAHPGTNAAGNAMLIKASLEHEEGKTNESQATLTTFEQACEAYLTSWSGANEKGKKEYRNILWN